jgi:membrane-associated protease RseP (regulator of RpoE activity)
VNLYWGLVNLMPVYPLDGGQATRALLTIHDPFRGVRRALIVSIVAGVVMALYGLLTQSIYFTALFGLLAAGSAQLLEGERRTNRPPATWRR